jgi:FlaA1/EpsC-like NDP-sugar epimerase
MVPVRRKILLNGLKLFDILIMSACFALATILTFKRNPDLTFNDFLAMRISIQNFAIFTLFIFIWNLIFTSMNLYSSRRIYKMKEEIRDLVFATTLGTAILLLSGFIFKIQIISNIFLILFWGLSTSLAIISRILIRGLLSQVRLHGRNLRHMLVVGTNPRSAEFARRIELKPEYGYRIIGFADQDWPGIDQFKKSGYPLVADLENLKQFIRTNIVDELVICLPLKSQYQQAFELVEMCEEQGIIARYVSDIFNVKNNRINGGILNPASAVEVTGRNGDISQIVLKRLIDIVISMVLLVLLAPPPF